MKTMTKNGSVSLCSLAGCIMLAACSAPGPHEVVVTVHRATAIPPQPACPDRSIECPALEQHNERMAQEASASQACVRTLISSLGGAASDEVLVLGNAFPAMLTWPRIQRLAAHPDVAYVEPRFGNAPPSVPPSD